MTAEAVAAALGLVPHPEGGAFAEVFRSPALVPHPEGGARRAAMTSIYFLLRAGEFSALHRVRSDETWHLYAGGALELALVHPDGRSERRVLGLDFAAGQRPQHTVPAHAWQAARPLAGVPWALCGCTVAPGFDFSDFELPARAALLELLPAHEALVREFTRP